MQGLETIFARNCVVKRIDKPTAAAFMAAAHRLGDTGCRYRYGLYVSRSTGASETELEAGTLVAVAEFSNARRWLKEGRKISSYEWIRYASLPGVRVTGGMSKLLNAFVEEVSPDDVMSYCDASAEDGGNAYIQLGFELEDRIERESFTNLKFRKKFTY